MFEYAYIIGVILFIAGLGFLVYISCKKYLLDVFPNENVDTFRQRLISLFLKKGWKVEEKKERIHIESGSFTAVDLHFKQNEQNVEVYSVSSATTLAWVLIAIGIFFFAIITFIVAFVADNNSRSFAKNTIRRLLAEIKERGFEA